MKIIVNNRWVALALALSFYVLLFPLLMIGALNALFSVLGTSLYLPYTIQTCFILFCFCTGFHRCNPNGR
jgi:hypothetical protein